MLIFRKLLEFRQMLRHLRIRQPFAVSTVIPTRQRNKVIPHNAYDIQVSVQSVQRGIMIEFMGRVSHEVSSLKSLTPIKWVADT